MFRERIKEHCGERAEILTLRSAPRFGATLFVADCMRHGRLVRMLGSIDRTGRIMEQSAMDLLRPERLVFSYERLMMAAFALVAEPRSALLLGLGGGAMSRHLAAYLPECEVTVVEREPVVRSLARRYFHVTRPVVMADAGEVVAAARRAFDVVLVDLYDGGGAADAKKRFWKDCLRALRPSGALAINWAEFVGASRMQDEARAIASTIGLVLPRRARLAPQRRPARADRPRLHHAPAVRSPKAVRRDLQTPSRGPRHPPPQRRPQPQSADPQVSRGEGNLTTEAVRGERSSLRRSRRIVLGGLGVLW
jgi:spermidine synthase